MKIERLHLENWKCFSESVDLDFCDIEIFSFPNGAGKTSVLEAIYYGLWGKTSGKMSNYQNHDGETNVKVTFEMDDVEYVIDRHMVAGSAVLYKDGEQFKEGIREVYDYMNSLVPYSLVKRLWFKGDIAECEILDFNFFKNEILADELDEAKRLYTYYNSESRAKNKQIKEIVCKADLRKVEEIDADIKDVSDKLKGSRVGTAEYNKALVEKDAVESFNKIKDYVPVPVEDIQRYKMIGNDVKNKIEKEKAKYVDESFVGVSPSALSSIVTSNNNKCKCVVCDGEWNDERKRYVEEVIAKGLKDQNLIDKLESDLKFKEKYDEQDIKKSEEWYAAKRRAESVGDYEAVIKSYDKASDDLWDKLDKLNHERDESIRNESNINLVSKLETDIIKLKERSAFLKEYMDAATEYYTSALLEKASETLHGINESYGELSICDNDILVSVRGQVLSISQLSRGERTMVALSLIYAIKDIFTPNMPLIFDESFASLSEVNNYYVIRLIQSTQGQVFIVSHSNQWVEFGDYDYQVTNVRTEW